MAAQGAHLTSTALDGGEAPSIFEVLAQESLIYSLRPALQHVFRVIAEKNPSRYGKLYQYSEEVYLGLQLILESYYLKHYSASFSENFYGLKRVVIENSDKSDNNISVQESDSEERPHQGNPLYNALPYSLRLRSLCFLVFVPYLKSKCDRWYEQLRDRMNTNSQAQNFKQKLISAFLGIYPVIHMSWELTLLTYQLMYIFDKSRFHSPFLKVAGVMLQNLTQLDMEDEGPNSKAIFHPDNSWINRLQLLGSKAFTGVALGLSSGLSVGVFFLQFLEWWYASDKHAASLTTLPTPPPPQVTEHPEVPKLHTICPLCQRVRTNDTVLAVSGFVFCYGCISQHLLKKQSCPVTHYPATSDHMVRLFLPES